MHYPFPDNSDSYWLKDGSDPLYPALQDDREADAVIVGAGITGLTIARVLQRAGHSVMVLERGTIANGTTSGTTGKVTAQHGIVYDELVQAFGNDNMQIYANAYMKAMGDIEALIKTEKLDCNWHKEDNYVYTADGDKVNQFKSEAVAAARLGLPAKFVTRLDLPFAVEGAVKFSGQASFNANRYCYELARLITRDGGQIFEQSKALSIQDGEPGRVSTLRGSITAKHIVIATLVPTPPLVGRISYGLFESPQTSYIVAGKTESRLRGMYISPDKDHYSILPIEDGKQRYMLIGGEGHVPGLGHGEPRKQKLIEYGKQWFDMQEIEYQWAAMDYTAYDKLPLIGKLYPWSKHIYTATGFKKWGLSSSMVAANVIRDLIEGMPTPTAQLFRTHRASAPLAISKNIFNKLKN